MAFDAGTIEAKLTVRLDEFSRDMDKAEARVKRFEHDGHKVKIAAEFDTGSLSRARKMFGDLDNMISRDAMNRLRSSPQGSVLGTLNALFSPHPVTGAPSPAQSAQGGLLGKMISSPSAASSEGVGGSGTGGGSASNDDSGNSNLVRSVLTSNAETTDLIKQQLTGNTPGNVRTTDEIMQELKGQGATNAETTDFINQKLEGVGASNQTTTDKINQVLAGNTPGNINTTDTISQKVVGSGPGNMRTTDTIAEKLDKKSTSDVEKAAGDSGSRAGGRWTVGFGAHLGPFFAMFHKNLTDQSKKTGDDSGNALDKGLFGGIGPGILGISTKMAGLVGLIGSALGALPALAGLIGVGMGAAMVTGLLVEAIKGNAKLSAQFKSLGTDFTAVLQKAVAPIVPTLSAALHSLVPLITSLQGPLTSIFKEIGPQIAGVFKNLGPLVRNLLGIMQAVAPAFGPFISSLEQLVSDILPGIETVIKATVPYIKEFAGILTGLGGNLGSLFATAAPAIGASMKILGGLLGVVSSLLPVVMKLAEIFAVALGPVFSDFAGVIKALLPTLTLIGSVIADLASAVVGDLAGAFGAVAEVIKAMGPGLNILAAAFGSLFSILENSGIFAEIGDALENLAPSIGKLANTLITEIAPVLPTLVGLFSQMLTIIVDLVTNGLGLLVKGLAAVIEAVPPGVLQAIVGGFIALKLAMMGFEGFGLIFSGITAAITAMSGALDFDTIALKAMYLLDNLVAVATKAWAVAQAILDTVMDANPIGLIIIAVAALGAAIYELVTHWTTVWATVKSVISDAWNFIFNGVGKYLLPLLGPAGLIILGVIELYQHWNTIWGDVKGVAQAIWTWFSGTFGPDISNFFTKTIPGWWDDMVGDAKMFAANIVSSVKAIWTWLAQTFGPDIVNFFTVTIPGWWNNAVAAAGRFATNVVNEIKGIWNWLTGTFGPDIANLFTRTLPGYWTAFYNAVVNTGTNVVKWLGRVPGMITKALGNLGNLLVGDGKAIMNGLLKGIESIWDDIVSFFKGLAKDILHALGINSPPAWAIDAGKHIMNGIGIGMTQAQSAATKAAKLVISGVSGVSAPLGGSAGANQAIGKSMAAGAPWNWTAQLWNDLNAVEMMEAGWNPNAKNPTSDAYGIAQFIGGPGEYYQWGGDPSTVRGQITGMYNYIMSRYGNPAAALLHEEAFHWYGAGGPINEPVVGYGINSGERYVFGERGPEYVVPGARPSGGGGDGAYAMLSRLDQLIDLTRQLPGGVGSTVGGAIGNSAVAASFRSRYPRGGS